jgi:hypothetical protein
VTPGEPEPPYHLRLEPDEVGVTATALRLLVSDEAHEAQIRTLARAVLDGLEGAPDERGIVSVALASKQMKITHTALRSLFRDLGREQADELEIVRRVLEKAAGRARDARDRAGLKPRSKRGVAESAASLGSTSSSRASSAEPADSGTRSSS